MQERWLPEVEKMNAMDIVKLCEEVSDEDFYAILGDEYFPYIDKAGFYEMQININCLSSEEGVDADAVRKAGDLFEGAYAAYHQVPDISFLA